MVENGATLVSIIFYTVDNIITRGQFCFGPRNYDFFLLLKSLMKEREKISLS